MNRLKILPGSNPKFEEMCFIYNISRFKSSSWYLHGKLQKRLGTDRAIFLNSFEFPEYLEETWIEEEEGFFKTQDIQINGKISVDVVGIDEPCVGFFWTTNKSTIPIKTSGGTVYNTTWLQKGLVCLESDEEGITQAKEFYDRKSIVI